MSENETLAATREAHAELRAAYHALRIEAGTAPSEDQLAELTRMANEISSFASTPAEAVEAEAESEETLVAASPAAPAAAPVEPKQALALVASGDITGHPVGTDMDLLEVATAVVKKTSTFKTAAKSRAEFSIAQIAKPTRPETTIRDNDQSAIDAAIAFCRDETKLPGGSLVAAGGWCSPSETWYDLLDYSSTDGLLSIPTVTLARGGVRLIPGGGPQFAAIYADTGFCFTEAQDIAGGYSLTSAVVQLTEGGAGLTSFTITVNGQTTASIDDDATPATVLAALNALSNVAPGDVVVTGTSAPLNQRLSFQGELAGDVVTVSTTPTGGSGVVTVTYITVGGTTGGPKPCYEIECPEWTDYRLEVCGVCVTGGYLQNRAFPELTQDIIAKVLKAHRHRVDTNVIADIVAGSVPVSIPTTGQDPGVAAPILNSVELQVLDIRAKYRMSDSFTIEVKLPAWTKGIIRADLAYRNGVNLIDVTDGTIMTWFNERNVSVQFLANLQPLGSASPATAYPSTISYLIYPAGTWVKGENEVIDLGVIHSPDLFAYNNYSALFTEEGWNVLPVGPESRIVELDVCPSGATGAATVACDVSA